MTTVNIPNRVRKAFVTRRWVRNGDQFRPDADLMTFLTEQVNQIVRYRTKSWTLACPLEDVPAAAGLGDRTRFRFAFRTSTHCKRLWVRVIAAPTGAATDAYTLVSFSLINNAFEDCRAEFHYGAGVSSLNVTPDTIGIAEVESANSTGTPVDVDADTEYECTVSDNDNARTIAVCVYEETMFSDTDNGYLASTFAALDPIFDSHRALLLPLIRNAYLVNAAPLITWSSNLDSESPTRTSATIANLLDTSITGAPTAASPGFTLSLAYLDRESGGGTIPCVMKVFGKCVAGAAGHVYLKNSAGTEIADCEVGDATETWFEVLFDLPAVDGKYDLQFAGDGTNLLTVRAVSIYQHAT